MPAFSAQDLVQLGTQCEQDLGARYCIQSRLGFGSYGVVYSATERGSGQQVAVKQIPEARHWAHGTAKFYQFVYRELMILRNLGGGSLIKLLNAEVPKEPGSHIYMVQERMPMDLLGLLCRATLDGAQVCFVAYQIFRALNYIHSAGVIHRDLSPTNVLIDPATALIKISDFGLARIYSHQGGLSCSASEVDALTRGVGTRCYQAPELVLAPERNYSTAIDLWSAGCILADMLDNRLHTSKEPLFASRDSEEQIARILAVVAVPTAGQLQSLVPNPVVGIGVGGQPQTPPPFLLRRFVETKLAGQPSRPEGPWRQLFPAASAQRPSAVALLDTLLSLDPERRTSAAVLLGHAYFADNFDPSDQPRALKRLKEKGGLEWAGAKEFRELARKESKKLRNGKTFFTSLH